MSDDDPHIEIAKLDERSSNHKDRLKKLEDNQRWGILTILGLLGKAAFDFFSAGL